MSSKPKLTINGTDSIIDIAMNVRSALKPIYDTDKIDSIVDNLFKPEPIGKCLYPIEQYLDITYNF